MATTEPPAASPEARVRQLTRDVYWQHADLLGRLHRELGGDEDAFAVAAQDLAEAFGSVSAATVGALWKSSGAGGAVAGAESVPEEERCAGLYRPGAMRHRLEQLVGAQKRYGHPFCLAVFDAEGPGTRSGDPGGGRETVQSVVGAALHDSVRLVDETFRFEEGALCVLAPGQTTVGGVQMAERLLGMLEELEAGGGMRIRVCAGVVACPEHGDDADELLRRADEAMWRARALGQPVGVGALEAVQDR